MLKALLSVSMMASLVATTSSTFAAFVPSDDDLYVVQDSRLFRVKSDTGAYNQLGGVDWANSTSMNGIRSVSADGSHYVDDLYIIQDQHLWRVSTDNGRFTALGGADWSGPTQMTHCLRFRATPVEYALYVIQDDILWRVSPATGAFVQLTGAIWAGASSITCRIDTLFTPPGVFSSENYLDIVQDNRLFRVDAETGTYAQVGGAVWATPTLLLSGIDRYFLLRVTDGRLYGMAAQSTEPDYGATTLLQTGWQGATSMAFRDQRLFVIRSSRLYSVDYVNGTRTLLGGADWGGPTLMALPDQY